MGFWKKKVIALYREATQLLPDVSHYGGEEKATAKRNNTLVKINNDQADDC